jgi:hypothetical protein
MGAVHTEAAIVRMNPFSSYHLLLFADDPDCYNFSLVLNIRGKAEGSRIRPLAYADRRCAVSCPAVSSQLSRSLQRW